MVERVGVLERRRVLEERARERPGEANGRKENKKKKNRKKEIKGN